MAAIRRHRFSRGKLSLCLEFECEDEEYERLKAAMDLVVAAAGGDLLSCQLLSGETFQEIVGEAGKAPCGCRGTGS